MANLWDHDTQMTVDPLQAKNLIETQFPELEPATVVLIGEGWDNRVFQVNERYIFRFPRRPMGADLLVAEAKALPALVKLIATPLPEPLFFGKPTPAYQWSFMGYRFLSGMSACKARLSIDERKALVEPLALFLKQLHGVSQEQFDQWHLPYDPLAKLNIAFRMPKANEDLTKLQSLGLFKKCSIIQSILSSLAGIDASSVRKLVHGDLYARHLLINENRQIAGIIDWGDVHINDPAVDLQIVFSFLPFALHETFWATYGEVSDLTKQLALFRAICHTLILTLYAHDIQDQDLLDEALLGLTFISHHAP